MATKTAAGDASSSTGNVDFQEEKSTQENEKFGLFVLEDLLEKNLVTDIGNIIYTAGEDLLSSKQMPLSDISEPFCDNIIIAKIYNRFNCEKQNRSKMPYTIKKKITSFSTNYLKCKFSYFLGTSSSSQPKYSIRTDGLAYSLWNMNNGRANGIREIIEKNDLTQVIQNKFRNPVYTIFKIDLADENLTTLVNQLPMILQELERNHYFLLDMDVTQDLTGIFNKKEMYSYLMRNEEFRNFNEIIDNDKSVGIDCLTWTNSNARVKIYNKFVCQVTSPGVRQTIGNHIVDFIDCPNNRLKETFQSYLAKNHGILRLEATIYNYSHPGPDKSYHPVKDCQRLLHIYKQYLKYAPIYSVPISSMWRKLTDELRNSCCLVNDNILQFVYWANGVTRKFTGIFIELPNEPNERKKLINYAISQLSFNNLPVNYVEIVEGRNGKNEVRERYIKKGPTYFSCSYTLHSSIPNDIDITETGLIPTNHVIPKVLRKPEVHLSERIQYQTTKIDLEFDSNRYEPSPKKQKLDLENTSQERDSSQSLVRDFRQNEWINLDSTGEYKIFAFAVVKCENSRSLVIVNAEKQNCQGIRKFYHVKGVNKNEFINRCYDVGSLIEDGYNIITASNMTIIHLPNEIEFAEFTTNGMDLFNGYSFPRIEELRFYTDETQYWDDTDSLFGIPKRRLITLFKNYDGKNVDSVGKYFVYAFTVDGYDNVGVLAQKKGTDFKRVYVLKGSPKKEFINRYNEKDSLTKQDYNIFNLNGTEIVYLATEQPLAEFKTNGTCTKVERLIFYEDLIFGMTKEELKNSFRQRYPGRLDTQSFYNVYAFTVIVSCSIVIVKILARKPSEKFKKVYSLQGKLKPVFSEMYNDLTISYEQNGFKKITCDDSFEIIYPSSEECFAKFETQGTSIFNGYEYIKTANLIFTNNELNDDVMEDFESDSD